MLSPSMLSLSMFSHSMFSLLTFSRSMFSRWIVSMWGQAAAGFPHFHFSLLHDFCCPGRLLWWQLMKRVLSCYSTQLTHNLDPYHTTSSGQNPFRHHSPSTISLCTMYILWYHSVWHRSCVTVPCVTIPLDFIPSYSILGIILIPSTQFRTFPSSNATVPHKIFPLPLQYLGQALFKQDWVAQSVGGLLHCYCRVTGCCRWPRPCTPPQIEDLWQNYDSWMKWKFHPRDWAL